MAAAADGGGFAPGSVRIPSATLLQRSSHLTAAEGSFIAAGSAAMSAAAAAAAAAGQPAGGASGSGGDATPTAAAALVDLQATPRAPSVGFAGMFDIQPLNEQQQQQELDSGSGGSSGDATAAAAAIASMAPAVSDVSAMLEAAGWAWPDEGRLVRAPSQVGPSCITTGMEQ
jgi:hypothetical protein